MITSSHKLLLSGNNIHNILFITLGGLTNEHSDLATLHPNISRNSLGHIAINFSSDLHSDFEMMEAIVYTYKGDSLN